MDMLTKEQRHKNMAAIKSRDTTIEVSLRKALWHEPNINIKEPTSNNRLFVIKLSNFVVRS